MYIPMMEIHSQQEVHKHGNYSEKEDADTMGPYPKGPNFIWETMREVTFELRSNRLVKFHLVKKRTKRITRYKDTEEKEGKVWYILRTRSSLLVGERSDQNEEDDRDGVKKLIRRLIMKELAHGDGFKDLHRVTIKVDSAGEVER